MLRVTYKPFMLSVIIMSVIILSVIILSVIILSVIMLSAVAPLEDIEEQHLMHRI
jgi:hypothetical protein